MKNIKRIFHTRTRVLGFILSIIAIIAVVSVPAIAAFGYTEYREALVDAVWFYDANKCGHDAAVDNVFSQWRGACHTTDGNDLGLNLTGGFHDNGGHVKYGLTQGYAASVLGWSLYEYKDIFDLSSQNTGKLQSTLKYFTDYLLACHPNANIFYYQVGDRNLEEPNWGPPETQITARPTMYWADSSHPATDVCGMTSAALTLMYLNYKNIDAVYANRCLQAAKELYALGKNYPGGSQFYYTLTSYWDDLAWAAMWLYIAEGDGAYLTDIDSYLAKPYVYGDPFVNQWTMCPDEMYLAVFCKMAQITGLQKYKDAVTYNLDYWKSTLTGTPGGLKFLNSWGVLQYAAAESMIALLYYGQTKDVAPDYSLTSFAQTQIDYILGENPLLMSYMIGFGTRWPLHPRHRAANGYYAYEDTNQPAKHTLFGAMVGGPNSDDTFTDEVTNYLGNEVEISYNANVVGALAGAIKYILTVPTTPKPTVPPTATPAPSATITPTVSPAWVLYLPTADQVTIVPVPEQSLVYVDLTFSSASFRVADPGQVAVAAGINPDGTTYLSNITVGTQIESYTGYSAQVITTLRITYQLHWGDTTYFAFRVNDQTVKDITIIKQYLPVTPTPTPTTPVTPTPTAGGIKVQMYNPNRAATTNSMNVSYRLFNNGTSTISLSNVKLRYYYTIDGEKPQSFWCDYSTVGSGNITGTFVKMGTPKTNADCFLETGFTGGAGSLAPGASIDIQIRFAKNDWSNYTLTNDYSFNTTATSYVDWTKVTDYVSGTLWWGVEP